MHNILLLTKLVSVTVFLPFKTKVFEEDGYESDSEGKHLLQIYIPLVIVKG